MLKIESKGCLRVTPTQHLNGEGRGAVHNAILHQTKSDLVNNKKMRKSFDIARTFGQDWSFIDFIEGIIRYGIVSDNPIME